MARERRTATDPGVGHNSMPTPDVVRTIFRRLDRLLDELASERDAYQERAREIRIEIDRALLDAENAGIPKRQAKAVLKARALEAKLEGVRKKLELGDVESYDAIRAALGEFADTPLGRAVLDKAGDRPAA